MNEGEYPVYGVTARIVDLSALKSLTPEEGSALLMSGANTLNIGDMYSKETSENLVWPFHLVDKGEYSIQFYSPRNGFWGESLKVRKVNNVWLSAYQVIRFSKGKKIVLRLNKPPDFPGHDFDFDKMVPMYDKPSKSR